MEEHRKHNYWKTMTLILVCMSLVLFVTLLMIIGKSKKQGNEALTADKLSQADTVASSIPDNWKTYSSEILTFRYPPEWTPRPIQIYPGHDSIIPFDLGDKYFLTISLIPYDSNRFSDQQKMQKITLETLIILDKEKHQPITIDHHKAYRLHAPNGIEGNGVPTEIILVDVPEKFHFVSIGFNNPLPSLGFDTAVGKWMDPLVASMQIGPQKNLVSAKPIDVTAPAQWKQYNKQFQGLHFEFQHPENCSVYDEDESSGDIEIICNQSEGVAVGISRLRGLNGYITDFEGASLREWFINNLIDDTPTSERFERNKLSLSELQFSNGSRYLQASYSENRLYGYLNNDTHDFYVGIPSNKGIGISDFRKLPKDTVKMILQSLKIVADATNPIIQPTLASAPPSPSPISVKQAYTYQLPAGWKTITDNTGVFEVGYDPSQNTVEQREREIVLGKIAALTGQMHIVSLRPYNGGSRHQFIYKQMGITDSSQDRMPGYYENEFTYNGWSCLVLHNISFSASGTIHGMCGVSRSQAFFFFGIPNEEVIKTVKLLK